MKENVTLFFFVESDGAGDSYGGEVREVFHSHRET